MDERKKILLGDKDILSRQIKDFYVDVNLSRDNREIIPYKYDNVFDLTKFYNKERNECRSFIIYGIIDSYTCDCNNLTIKVFDGASINANVLSTVQTQDIVSTQMPFQNIYGRLRGRYIIDNLPSNFTGYSVFIKLESSDSIINQQIQDNVFEQQLVFTTLTLSSSGERIVEKLNYGLNEAVTDCDGNVFEVNNDFDFFYNKHWIKKNLSVSNLNRIWIGNEATKFCEIEQNPQYHGRTVYESFFSGYFAYNETMEVYEINESPTGNYEPNAITSTHYVPHVPSNGLCPTANTYSFEFERVFTPAQGNSVYSAPTQWSYYNVVEIYPPNPDPNGWPLYDSRLMETEPVSGTNIYNNYVNNLWEFLYFRYKNGQQFSGDSFNFNISQNTIIEGVYREVCPWTLYVNPIFINPNLFPEPAVPYSAGTYDGYTFDQKAKYYNNENARIIISQPDYYIENFHLTGSSLVQNNYTPSNYITFGVTMTEDTYVDLFYRKYLNLNISSKTFVIRNNNTGHTLDTTNAYSVELSATSATTDYRKVDVLMTGLAIDIPSINAPTTRQATMVSGELSQIFYNMYGRIERNSNVFPDVLTVGEVIGNSVDDVVLYYSNGIYHNQDILPGYWSWSGSVNSGGTNVYFSPQSQNPLDHFYFKMTADTAIQISWIFHPDPYSIA